MEQVEFRAMGCSVRAVLSTGEGGTVDRLAEVAGWFGGWEADLSRFRGDSELSRLNASGRWPMAVGPALWSVLQAAVRAAAWSGGLVVPTLLADVERAGYDLSFGTPAAGRPDAAQGGGGCAGCQGTGLAVGRRRHSRTADWRDIRLDADHRTVTLPPGVRLDLGGIAKGWAADEAAQRLAAHGSALVDAGGDIAVSGPPDAAREGYALWPVAVADPFRPDGYLTVLWLRQGGVATSGRDYRRWKRNGRWQHHIIDPRTGAPAVTDVLTATVIAPTACQAETAAKVALILGSRKALVWIEARPTLAGLIVTEDGLVTTSRRMARHLAPPLVLGAPASSPQRGGRP
jgi:thiamine biosynthesis lipoprotein